MTPREFGPYRTTDHLGAGAMGQVWQAELTEPAMGLAVGDTVAIKLLHRHLLDIDLVVKRFLREGRSA